MKNNKRENKKNKKTYGGGGKGQFWKDKKNKKR